MLDSQKVEYGKGAAAPNNPEREADAQYTYEFSGWDSDFSNITKDITVTAQYDKTVNSYTVTFVDHDGTVLDSQKVEYGKGAAAPNNPEREVDAQYTYEFSGWDSDFSNITKDIIVTAQYDKTVNSYTVTFVDHDGTVLDSQKVEYGKGAAAPNNPEREADAQYTYEFSGWDSDFTNVVSDMSVQALYLVTKIDEPSVLETPAMPENANSETTEVGTSEYSPSGDNSVHTGNRINSVYILCLILISFAVLLIVRRKMRLENLKGENKRENIK